VRLIPEAAQSRRSITGSNHLWVLMCSRVPATRNGDRVASRTVAREDLVVDGVAGADRNNRRLQHVEGRGAGGAAIALGQGRSSGRLGIDIHCRA
jgi:hypothetical protein